MFPGNTGSDLPGAESGGSGFALPYAGWGTHTTALLTGWRRTENGPGEPFEVFGSDKTLRYGLQQL